MASVSSRHLPCWTGFTEPILFCCCFNYWPNSTRTRRRFRNSCCGRAGLRAGTRPPVFPAAAGCGPRLDWRHENQNPVNKTHPAGTEVWDPVTAGKPGRTAEIRPLVSVWCWGWDGSRRRHPGGVQVRPGTNFPESRTPDQSNQGENTSFSGLTINPAPFIGPNSVKIPRRLLGRQSRSEADQESWFWVWLPVQIPRDTRQP